ncbi:type III-A CRISPR-associated RAMP protein Csm3 [Dehalococcoidales bacterium]|nr:type III-A CRISPR-associated RAMP protein Csm3 [Dehalococcoidales bacterium]
MFEFKGKYIIEMDLVCLTGLHIGGIAEGYEIGGMENPVIKTPVAMMINSGGETYEVPANCPYIPGSSLKGKLRSFLEWVEGRPMAKDNLKTMIKSDGGKLVEVEPDTIESIGQHKAKAKIKGKKDEEEIEGQLWYQANHCTCGDCDVCQIFGSPAREATKRGPTRLYVFDAFPTKETIDDLWRKDLGEGIFTEVKMENVIDRLSSQANPRQMERVPAGSKFRIRMIYDIYQDEDVDKLRQLFVALSLLEDNPLGGGGSRGSGRVSFENFSIVNRSKAYYKGEEEEVPIQGLNGKKVKDIKQNFDQIFKGKA